jgi:hypothetical protein
MPAQSSNPRAALLAIDQAPVMTILPGSNTSGVQEPPAGQSPPIYAVLPNPADDTAQGGTSMLTAAVALGALVGGMALVRTLSRR